jgi:hypothetical protein
MKWKVKPEPDFGDMKTVTKYAWIPTKLDTPMNTYVWLEFYEATYYFRLCHFGHVDWSLDRKYQYEN